VFEERLIYSSEGTCTGQIFKGCFQSSGDCFEIFIFPNGLILDGTACECLSRVAGLEACRSMDLITLWMDIFWRAWRYNILERGVLTCCLSLLAVLSVASTSGYETLRIQLTA